MVQSIYELDRAKPRDFVLCDMRTAGRFAFGTMPQTGKQLAADKQHHAGRESICAIERCLGSCCFVPMVDRSVDRSLY